MPPDEVWTSHPPLYPSDFSHAETVTLSDTVADQNLAPNGRPYKYLHNAGTSGLVQIRWLNGTDEDIYLNQGVYLARGQWLHAYTTGTGAGVSLRGLVG